MPPKGSGKANGKAKAKANGAAPKKKNKSDRRKAAAAGPGHNRAELKKAVRLYANRFNELLDEKEKLAGECMSDVKNLYEKAANETGMSRKVLRIALTEDRREQKRKAAEKEMEPLERQNLNILRGSLELPLFMAADLREQTVADGAEGDADPDDEDGDEDEDEDDLENVAASA